MGLAPLIHRVDLRGLLGLRLTVVSREVLVLDRGKEWDLRDGVVRLRTCAHHQTAHRAIPTEEGVVVLHLAQLDGATAPGGQTNKWLFPIGVQVLGSGEARLRTIS